MTLPASFPRWKLGMVLLQCDRCSYTCLSFHITGLFKPSIKEICAMTNGYSFEMFTRPNHSLELHAETQRSRVNSLQLLGPVVGGLNSFHKDGN